MRLVIMHLEALEIYHLGIIKFIRFGLYMIFFETIQCIIFILTTIFRVSSLTFLVLLHNAKADEWENITGASLASIVSLDVFLELCDRSIIMPSRFNSFITVQVLCSKKNKENILFSTVWLSQLSNCLCYILSKKYFINFIH